MGMLFELIRDLAVIAAAAGVGWWTWDRYRLRDETRDQAARAALASERWQADMVAAVATLAARAEAVEGHLAETRRQAQAAAARTEATAAHKVRVHALLQGTDDPYLTFGEIEAALGQPADAEAATRGPVGDDLRSVLIEMLADGVIAQLDRDRYFIASDYEAGADTGVDSGDEDEPGEPAR